MSRRLVLYEDRHWRALRPLTDLLPVPALTFGASDLARRAMRAAGVPLFAIEARARAMACWHHAPVPDTSALETNTEAIVLNAAALPGEWLAEALDARAPSLWMGSGRVVGARLPLGLLRPAIGQGDRFEQVLLGMGLPTVAVEAPFLTFPWEMIDGNAAAIAADLADAKPGVHGDVHALACLVAPERITVARGAKVGPYAVLDASAGPVYVAHGAVVAPHTVVNGPCVIGGGTQLLGGFVSGTTFGPECRVAGEVEASVWQGYGNKRHHGFLGHSLVGEWVNLGALTTTSDLKNNYGHVRVRVDREDMDSGSSKVGSLIGSHVKTGIGTLLPTGASIGTGANVFGGGRFAPKHVPAFAWWDGEHTVDHELTKFHATARVALSRRARTFGPAEEAACAELFASTADERRPMTGGR